MCLFVSSFTGFSFGLKSNTHAFLVTLKPSDSGRDSELKEEEDEEEEEEEFMIGPSSEAKTIVIFTSKDKDSELLWPCTYNPIPVHIHVHVYCWPYPPSLIPTVHVYHCTFLV